MRLLILVGLVLLTGLSATQPAEAADRPNILFCFADDWGWPHAGAFGDPVVKTPAFDRLAREGVLFDHAHRSAGQVRRVSVYRCLSRVTPEGVART